MARVSTVVMPKPEFDALVDELARLREERDKLHALYNRAQDDASREAEVRVNQGFELARLREARDVERAWAEDYKAQRDDLLATLREIEGGTYEGYDMTPGGTPTGMTFRKRMSRKMMRAKARAAIAKVGS